MTEAGSTLPPCVILAGGQSRRMGGEHKFLKTLGGMSLMDRVIQTIKPQVSDILINSNTPISRDDYPIVSDMVDGHLGPLAGILTGLKYFKDQGSKATHLLCVPSDAPFIPLDLVKRLTEGLSGKIYSISMAYSDHRIHPVISLWPFALLEDLEKAVTEENLRKILVFAERYSLRSVEWPIEGGDPFFNINRPEDLEEAANRLID
ncbi:molybdenum cofactor guanylyltransferase MobA [Sneathiella limimaris]|uniref:molybdenum cofactor guanylyltransferase MobA n=1 Tax=Sneathiella limimaris TaxID=1964213 RepID=UPI0019D24C4A|nr:molybdenum cofactor guanylyltransferase MobA [Sneathiella limimaris]